MNAQAYFSAFQERRGEFLAELEALVNMDSPSDDLDAVRALQDRLEQILQGRGFDTRREGPAQDVVVARRQGGGHGLFCLLGHVDTVFDRGEAARRPWRVEGDRAHGPGVADMKGGVLLAVHACELLAAAGAPFRELRLILNADEEIGSLRSADTIMEQVQGAQAVFVLEPGRPGGEIVSARKGVGDFLLQAHGRPAHAGTEPQKGHNAIVELARRVLAIQSLNGGPDGVTYNVGRIEGGTRPNVVAEWASCQIDVRITSMRHIEEVPALLRQAALTADDPGVSLQLEGGFGMPPIEKTAATERLLAVARSCAQELGFTLRDTATGGGSDGNRVVRAGIPVLDGLGPVGGAAHSADEYLEIDSIAQRGALLAAMIARLGAGA